MRKITFLSTFWGKNTVSPEKLRRAIIVNKSNIPPETKKDVYLKSDSLLTNKYGGMGSSKVKIENVAGNCDVLNVVPFRLDLDCKDGASVPNILKQLNSLKKSDPTLDWLPHRPVLLLKVDAAPGSSAISPVYKPISYADTIHNDMIVYLCEGLNFKVSIKSENESMSRSDKIIVPTSVMAVQDLKNMISHQYSIPVGDQKLLISTPYSKGFMDISSESFKNQILLNLGIAFEYGEEVSIVVKNINYELKGGAERKRLRGGGAGAAAPKRLRGGGAAPTYLSTNAKICLEDEGTDIDGHLLT